MRLKLMLQLSLERKDRPHLRVGRRGLVPYLHMLGHEGFHLALQLLLELELAGELLLRRDGAEKRACTGQLSSRSADAQAGRLSSVKKGGPQSVYLQLHLYLQCHLLHLEIALQGGLPLGNELLRQA